MPSTPSVDAGIRAEILALRTGGASFHRIAALLNQRGVKGYLGGRWYGATVSRIVHGSSAENELAVREMAL